MKMTAVAATCAGGTLAAVVIGALLLGFVMLVAGCGELPQDGPKPFAAKEETQPYAGGLFKGDKALYEKTLAGRSDTMNEYLITQDAKTEPARPRVATGATSPAAAIK